MSHSLSSYRSILRWPVLVAYILVWGHVGWNVLWLYCGVRNGGWEFLVQVPSTLVLSPTIDPGGVGRLESLVALIAIFVGLNAVLLKIFRPILIKFFPKEKPDEASPEEST